MTNKAFSNRFSFQHTGHIGTKLACQALEVVIVVVNLLEFLNWQTTSRLFVQDFPNYSLQVFFIPKVLLSVTNNINKL